MVIPLFTVALVLVAACVAPSAEQAWGLGEARTFLDPDDRRPRALGDNDMAIAVPVGVHRGQFTIVATDSVDIGAGSRIRRATHHSPLVAAAVAALGPIQIGRDSSLGAIYGMGRSVVNLDSGVEVNGYVKAHGTIRAASSELIRDGILERALGGMESFRWHVDFPDLGPARKAPVGESPNHVPPGGYSELKVAARTSARLSAGAYFFDRLALEPDAVLEIDDTQGPVYVWVRRELQLLGVMRPALLEANVLVGYFGDAELRLPSSFVGTLVAPRASVVLAAVEGGHHGAFFARAVTLQPGTSIDHGPFPGPAHVPPPSPCSACREAIDAELTVRQACEGQCRDSVDAARSECAERCLRTRSRFEEPDWYRSTACERYARCQLRYGYAATACSTLGAPEPLATSACRSAR